MKNVLDAYHARENERAKRYFCALSARYRDALQAIVDHSDGAPDDYAHEVACAALEIDRCSVCAGRDGSHAEGCQYA